MTRKKKIGHKQALELVETLSKRAEKATNAREKAEKSLKEREAQLRFLADNQPAMIWGAGMDKLCNYFNKVWLDFTGRSLEQELGNGWTEGVHPDDFDRCLKIYIEAFDRRQKFKMEYRLRKADGVYAWISDHGIPEYSLDGEFLGYMGTCVDISEPKRLAETLREQEEKYQTIFESSNDAIMLLKENGFFDCNTRTLAMFGCKNKSEFISFHPADFSPPLQPNGQSSLQASKEKISTALKEGLCRFEWVFCRKNGKPFPAEVLLSTFDYGGERALQATVRDITLQKEAEEEIRLHREHLETLVVQRTEALRKTHDQLLHSEKLVALGKLTGSIAHEFNNPIYGIRNILEQTLEFLAQNEEFRPLLTLAIKECNRIADMVKRLREFYKPSDGIKDWLDIHQVLDDTLLLMKKQLMLKKIELKKNYAADLPKVQLVADQIKQVFLNLLQNAEEATSPEGGVITVTTESSDANTLKISIKDTGEGIPPENMGMIFDSFFSTKAAKGTGLGLSVCHGIISSFGGKIEVKSELGKGATFTITIPCKGTCQD